MKMKEFGDVHNFGVEILNSSFICYERYWFVYEESARNFKEELIREHEHIPAFVRIVKVI